MNDDQFSIVFDGSSVEDHELFGVKQRLKEIFKANRARVDALFVGKPVALKRNLSKAEALKYRLMLKKSGIRVKLVAEGLKAKKTSSEKRPPSLKDDTFSLAPLGSDLVDKAIKPVSHPQLFQTNHLSLQPQGGDLLKDGERQVALPIVIDEAHREWELSHVGEDLLKKSEKEATQAIEFDTSSFSLSKANTGTFAPAEKSATQKIKTDHLSLSVDRDE